MGNSLKHWGILGMHWGIRKDETKTGRSGTGGNRLTGGSSKKTSSGSTAKPSSADHTKMVEIKHKKLEEMSNAELQHIANRMNLVNQYKNLNPSKIKKGRNLVKGAFAEMANFTLSVGTIAAAAVAAKQVYEFAIRAPHILPVPTSVLAKRLAEL